MEAIARAFLKNAPIILLDVDNETLIQNKTVMIIAHRVCTVANVDHIVVSKDGIVAEQGSPETLLT